VFLLCPSGSTGEVRINRTKRYGYAPCRHRYIRYRSAAQSPDPFRRAVARWKGDGRILAGHSHLAFKDVTMWPIRCLHSPRRKAEIGVQKLKEFLCSTLNIYNFSQSILLSTVNNDQHQWATPGSRFRFQQGRNHPHRSASSGLKAGAWRGSSLDHWIPNHGEIMGKSWGNNGLIVWNHQPSRD